MTATKLFLLWGLIVLALLTVSCESIFVKVVDPTNIPIGEQKLTVHCYISPQDTVLTAVVNRSRAVLGAHNSVRLGSLPDATVTLSDGDRSVVLRYNDQQDIPLHRIDARKFPIQVGKMYSLAASLPTGERVTATCTVPDSVPITSFRIDSLPDPNIGNGLGYYVRMIWQDPVGVVNYYRVAGDNEYGSVGHQYVQGRYIEVPIRAVNELFVVGESPYLTDQNLDGRTMISPEGRLSYTLSSGKIYANRPILINLYLLNADVNYYRYHESLERAVQAQSNPFAEPTPVFSNITGGLGCFGAYNRSTWAERLN